MNITSGKIAKAQKIVIYGPEGIGKSTFASQFPKPLFIDTEGSTKNMDVERFDKPTSWTMLKSQIDYVKSTPSICKTLIIDTIDWAEQLCIDNICSTHGKKGIEDFGYGNGYVYEKEEFGRFLNLLEDVVDIGINIVLTAHAQLKKFEQPDELGAYDRWELKLGKKTGSQISPLVKEWADMVLFANYKSFAVQTDKDGKKFKGQGGKRTMYATHHTCWDAKNRHGLADEMDFNYAQIAHCITSSAVSEVITTKKEIKVAIDNVVDNIAPQPTIQAKTLPDYIPKALQDLMLANDVSEEDIRLVVSQKGYYPQDTPISNYDESFVNGVLIGAWKKVLSMIMNMKDLPFN